MADTADFPFRGWITWLTPEQGGRETGPPIPRTTWPYYAATAYIIPRTADTGLASFVLRNFDAGAWRSSAEGRWMASDVSDGQTGQARFDDRRYRGLSRRRLLHRRGRSRLVTAYSIHSPDQRQKSASAAFPSLMRERSWRKLGIDNWAE